MLGPTKAADLGPFFMEKEEKKEESKVLLNVTGGELRLAEKRR